MAESNQIAMRRRLEDLQKLIAQAIQCNEDANVSGISLSLEEIADIAAGGVKITDRVLFSGPNGKMIDMLKDRDTWTK